MRTVRDIKGIEKSGVSCFICIGQGYKIKNKFTKTLNFYNYLDDICIVGNSLAVTLNQGGDLRLAIDAPKDVPIVRGEVYERNKNIIDKTDK